MCLTSPSLLPQPPPVSKRPKRPSSPSHSSLTPSLRHMNRKEFSLPTPAGRLMKLSSGQKISPTPNIIPSMTGILPVLKMPQPDVSSQLGKAVEREVTTGKPLLERLGMRQLSLLECLGMPIKKGRTLEACDGAGTMTTKPNKLSQNRRRTMTTSMIHTMPGTGARMGGVLPGEVGQISALSEKLKCSRPSTILIVKMLSVVSMPKEIVHHSLTPFGAISSATTILTLGPSSKTSSLSRPSMMTPSNLGKVKNSQFATDPQGRGDRSRLKVTGSPPSIGTVMPSSALTCTTELHSESTTNISPPS